MTIDKLTYLQENTEVKRSPQVDLAGGHNIEVQYRVATVTHLMMTERRHIVKHYTISGDHTAPYLEQLEDPSGRSATSPWLPWWNVFNVMSVLSLTDHKLDAMQRCYKLIFFTDTD